MDVRVGDPTVGVEGSEGDVEVESTDCSAGAGRVQIKNKKMTSKMIATINLKRS